MIDEKLELAIKLKKRIEDKRMSLKKIQLAVNDVFVARSFIVDFTGCDGVVEFDEKDFKTVCRILLPIISTDLQELEKQYENL